MCHVLAKGRSFEPFFLYIGIVLINNIIKIKIYRLNIKFKILEESKLIFNIFCNMHKKRKNCQYVSSLLNYI